MPMNPNGNGPVNRLAKLFERLIARGHGYGPVGRLAKPPVDLLICFAVQEEMKFFARRAARADAIADGAWQVWMTGIGRRNAALSIREAIAAVQPERVITAGFAGGLNPALKFGDIVYDQDFDAGFGPELENLGAIPARFYCHRRVAITAEEKRDLWKSTGADAVEMESSVIRNICREFGLPGATIRVISDDATQDLPLDFNELMTSEDRINFFKLAGAVISRPSRIPKLIEFQGQTVEAARRLGWALDELLRAKRS